MIRKLRILPRWIIFSIDLVISIISIFIAFMLRLNFNFHALAAEHIGHVLLLILITNTVIYFAFQTYAGIIRYTSTQDALRILFASLSTTVILFIINIINYYDKGAFTIPNSVIIINFFCSYLFLISYRLLVKHFYDHYLHVRTIKKNTVIFGAGRSGLITKRLIMNDTDSNLKIIAFLDDDASKTQKKLDGLPIMNPKNNLTKFFKENKVQEVIIAVQALHPERKNEIVDWCLAHNVQVLTVPPAKNWVKGELKLQQIKNVKIEDLLERDPISIDNQLIFNQLRNKRLLITGAAGSIGSELVRQVIKFNPELVVLCDQAETPLHSISIELAELSPSCRFELFIGDIRDKARMSKLFELFKPQIVYHAAAYKHVPVMEGHPAEAILNNVLGTKNIAELSVKYNIDRFVMISTDKAVNPTNIMGASKRIAEIYTQALNNHLTELQENVLFSSDGIGNHTRFITTRFGNVLGSNGSVIPLFKQQIEKGGPVTVTHENITRYFMTIPEACQLVLEAGSMGKGGEIFVFDMGRSVKIVDLAKKMIRLSGMEPNKDIEIKFTGLRPGEKLYEELLNTAENTMPTYHEKIMIAKVRPYDYELIKGEINKLINFAHNSSDRDIVVQMKNIVPEFKSNNSVFEELDRKKKVFLVQ